jgi:Predicted transcriptional regulators
LDLIQILKAISDENRIRILNILSHGDLCVCEIEKVLNINQSNASRHLNKLVSSEILKNYKNGLYVYYKINKDVLDKFSFISDLLNNEIIKLDKCGQDYEKLKKYKSKGMSCDSLKEWKNEEE